ncbi:hypothetical protein QYF36_004141 [Acer negundo]|nr:hypothetical protein QYF36_004141 [Acer negundo]
MLVLLFNQITISQMGYPFSKGLLNVHGGQFVGLQMILDGYNVPQGCLQLKMDLKGLWKFLKISGSGSCFSSFVGLYLLGNACVIQLCRDLGFHVLTLLYFVNTKMSFSKLGLACHIAKIHSEVFLFLLKCILSFIFRIEHYDHASGEKNAREIKEYIEEIYWGKRGHSKGGVDAAAALSLYWPDLKDKVAGLALAQSPYGGSPIASDILREGQLGDYVNLRKLMEILICKVIKGDMQSLEDLTYEWRKEFLRKHQLPRVLPIVSFHTEAGITPAVLATLSHVAHAELPSLSSGQSAKIPVVMSLGAGMAACAQLLQVRYSEKSDGLVTCCDAEVPRSIVVRSK